MTAQPAIDAFEEGGTVHSRRGPSSAHRWMNCRGSTNVITKLGDKARKAGIEAAEGTAAHTLLARCLGTNTEPWEYYGENIKVEGYTFTVNEEMMNGVQMAIDWARDKVTRFADKQVTVLAEHRVAAPQDEDAFGTSDIIIIVPGERLIIGDFKYGVGIVVEPDDEQLRCYGHYAFETFTTVGCIDVSGDPVTDNEELFPDPHTVCELYIIQPRGLSLEHPKGPIRRHVTSKLELQRFFFGEVLPALSDGKRSDALLTIGDWCRHCPAMEYCPALHNEAAKFKTDIEPIALTDDQLNSALVVGEAIAAQMKKLNIEAFNRVKMGRKLDDWKLVRKIGDRIWKSGAEDAVVAEIGPEKAFTKPALRSPAQIDEEFKKVGKKLTTRWAMKPQTGLTIARRTDKREEVKDAMDAYDKATGGTEQEDWES